MKKTLTKEDEAKALQARLISGMRETVCKFCASTNRSCGERSPEGYYCSREAGHKGPHRACGHCFHEITIWKD